MYSIDEHDGQLALLDADAWPADALEGRLASLAEQASLRQVAIFNADDGARFERLLIWPKLSGFFHRDTSEEQLVKGIRAVLDGEFWIPRRMLADYVEQTRGMHKIRTTEAAGLTFKEAATLRAMIEGASNADIAGTLHVSPHTVKTHVYNLFRKINVSNRVQAVSWALKNMEQAQGEAG